MVGGLILIDQPGKEVCMDWIVRARIISDEYGIITNISPPLLSPFHFTTRSRAFSSQSHARKRRSTATRAGSSSWASFPLPPPPPPVARMASITGRKSGEASFFVCAMEK